MATGSAPTAGGNDAASPGYAWPVGHPFETWNFPTMSRRTTIAAALLLLGACAGPRESANQPPAEPPAAPAAAAPAVAAPAGTPTVVVYKTPSCGCCSAWVDRMREAGFTVEVHDQDNVDPEKQRLGVPLHLASCHTGTVGGYALEGHVPPATVLRLLRERPQVAGVAVPGMPAGSPGMEMGGQKDPYEVVAWTRDGSTRVYETH